MRFANSELPESEVDNLVRTRMARQALLSRFRPPTLSVIVDEMVLRRPVGEPGVMYGQLQHLLAMSQRPKIDMRVVPFTTGAYPGLTGPALILEFADQPTLVYAETRGASGLLEEAPVIRKVRLAWREILSVALSPEDSARLIADISGELTR